jgi:diguanylate cyclase (GGDEF)-like protein
MFAKGLKDSCREYDYAARMGGDEFVVIAPGLTQDAAAEMAQRLEAIIAEAGKTVCGEGLVSVSIGQAFYPADGTNAEHLLAEADRRMYAVKHSHHASTGGRDLGARSASTTSF